MSTLVWLQFENSAPLLLHHGADDDHVFKPDKGSGITVLSSSEPWGESSGVVEWCGLPDLEALVSGGDDDENPVRIVERLISAPLRGIGHRLVGGLEAVASQGQIDCRNLQSRFILEKGQQSIEGLHDRCGRQSGRRAGR